jgi:hypothetical protein
MTDELEIGALTARVQDDAIVVRLELVNDSDRTLHAYGQARRVVIDPATGVLVVGLTDREADTDGDASTFVLPAFTAVDPHGTTTVELRVPRAVTRITGATAQGAPVLERIPLDQATEIQAEVAWSDTPFYQDPRAAQAEAAHPAAQLRRWERGLATARARVQRPRRRRR